MLNKCESCKFYRSDLAPDKTIIGNCFRYPPTANAILVPAREGVGVQVITVRPQVDGKNDYCGDFIAKLSGVLQ
jgi:hypothetical protein